MSSGEGPAGDRPLRADARRNMEKVMAAAAEAFAADGLDVPLEDIARSAGVRAGTIYNRFGSREGLLDAVVADAAAGWLRAVIDRAAGPGTAWGRFAAFVQGMCEEQAADPVFNDVFSRRYPDAPRLQAVCGQSLAFGAELIRDAQADGALRPGFRRRRPRPHLRRQRLPRPRPPGRRRRLAPHPPVHPRRPPRPA